MVGIALNVAFVAIEATFGVLSRSVALVADAAHNLSDVLGLAMAGGAYVLAQRTPSARRTYGLRKTTVLAALANALFLMLAIGGVAWEAIGRIRNPTPVEGRTVMIVAAIGVVVNGVSATFFAKGHSHDVNVKGAYLHLLSDAAVSLGVVLTGLAISQTGWMWLDPVVSIAVSVVILAGTWGLLKQSLNLALDAVPDGIDPGAVNAFLSTLPGVSEVHDLHIWAMSTTENALTAHLVMTERDCAPGFLGTVCKELHDRFGIGHTTLQVEPPGAPDPCKQAPADAL